MRLRRRQTFLCSSPWRYRVFCFLNDWACDRCRSHLLYCGDLLKSQVRFPCIEIRKALEISNRCLFDTFVQNETEVRSVQPISRRCFSLFFIRRLFFISFGLCLTFISFHRRFFPFAIILFCVCPSLYWTCTDWLVTLDGEHQPQIACRCSNVTRV